MSFSSENAVPTPLGEEILSHREGGVDLTRKEEVRGDEKIAAEKQRKAIDKAVTQGQLQRLQQAAWQ